MKELWQDAWQGLILVGLAVTVAILGFRLYEVSQPEPVTQAVAEPTSLNPDRQSETAGMARECQVFANGFFWGANDLAYDLSRLGLLDAEQLPNPWQDGTAFTARADDLCAENGRPGRLIGWRP